MSGLQRFEQRLEQFVSGAFARAFRSAVQPVEISAALQRECDNNAQILSRQRRMVPNDFHVELSQADLDRLAPYDSALVKELTSQLTEHAEKQSYVFSGPVTIGFEAADDLTIGRFRVRSQAHASVISNATQTQVRRARAYVEVNGTRHPLQPPGLVVGRGTEADLRINDPGVSRRHVEFTVDESADGGVAIAVQDLGSTNGMLVDGHRVATTPLNDGSEVRVGRTTLTVRVSRRTPMSELTLFLIKISYLAILWIFVLSAISVVRSDMFGARVPQTAREAAAPKPRRQPKQRARKGAPTHVLVVDGANQGERADLAAAPILIGRGNDAAIRLDDDYVSTRHARIAASGDQWFVEDLGSTNGTYIGSARITQPTTLALGTQVRIGKTILELRK